MDPVYESVLEKATVINHLHGDDVFSIIDEMLEVLLVDGVLTEGQIKPVKESIYRRQALAMPFLTKEVVVPHGRIDVVDDFICVIGIHHLGFNAIDVHKSTHVVLLLIDPPSAESTYKGFRANVSRALLDPKKLAALCAAKDRATVLACLSPE